MRQRAGANLVEAKAASDRSKSALAQGSPRDAHAPQHANASGNEACIVFMNVRRARR